MAFQVFGIIKTVFDSLGAKVIGASEGKTAFFLYGDGMLRDVVIGKTALFYGCIYLAVYVAAYYFAYFFIGRALHGYDDLKISNKSILALSGFVLLAEILLHALLVYITDGYNAVYTVITYAYNILSCLFIFYLQKSLLSEKQLQKELTLVNHMLQQEREQYEVPRHTASDTTSFCAKHRPRVPCRNRKVDKHLRLDRQDGQQGVGRDTYRKKSCLYSKEHYFCMYRRRQVVVFYGQNGHLCIVRQPYR